MNDQKLADTIFSKYSASKKRRKNLEIHFSQRENKSALEGFRAHWEEDTLHVFPKDRRSLAFVQRFFQQITDSPLSIRFCGTFRPRYSLRPFWVCLEDKMVTEWIDSLLGFGYNTLLLSGSEEQVRSVTPAVRQFQEKGGLVVCDALLADSYPEADGQIWNYRSLGWNSREWMGRSLTFLEFVEETLVQLPDKGMIWVDLTELIAFSFAWEDIISLLMRNTSPRVRFLCPFFNHEGDVLPIWKQIPLHWQSSCPKLYPLFSVADCLPVWLDSLSFWAEWLQLDGWVTQAPISASEVNPPSAFHLSGLKQWFSCPAALLFYTEVTSKIEISA